MNRESLTAVPRARCGFRKRDLKAAVEVARATGLEIGRVEIDRDGKIVVVTSKPSLMGELDAELAEFEAKQCA